MVCCAPASDAISPETIQTRRGTMRFLRFTPDEGAPRHRMILAHGFMRKPATMRHLAKDLASAGVETICPEMTRSSLLAGRHAANAADLVALRESLGWDQVIYAGFSAGGLSALLAAAEDETACNSLILLDPVDHYRLGFERAHRVRLPTLALIARPGAGNAMRNAATMLDRLPDGRIISFDWAEHCDFEAEPSFICHQLTGTSPDIGRASKLHREVLSTIRDFLNLSPTLNTKPPLS